MDGRRVGGIFGLVDLLEEHGEAIEADLLRYYQVDVADLFSGDLSPRRVLALIRHLPRDAATKREVAGDVTAWGETEHLLALAIDTLNVANWQRAGDKRNPRPRPVPRPGDPVTRHRMTPEQVRDRLLEQKARMEVKRGD